MSRANPSFLVIASFFIWKYFKYMTTYNHFSIWEKNTTAFYHYDVCHRTAA